MTLGEQYAQHFLEIIWEQEPQTYPGQNIAFKLGQNF